MRNNRGFTALELATTMAIVAVIAALVMPPYLKWLRSYRLNGAVTNLVADMEMARVRAIRENALVVVQFAGDNYAIFIDNGAGSGTSGDWIRQSGEDLLRDRKLPAGIKFDLANLTLANDRTRFNGRGIPPGVTAPETIPLINATRRCDIILNRLGHMVVQ